MSDTIGPLDREVDVPMPPGQRGRDPAITALRPKEWRGADLLTWVYELNAACLALLSRLAIANDVEQTFEFVLAERRRWAALPAGACERVARCPFLLLDLRFQSEGWWHWARTHPTERWQEALRVSRFPSRPAVALMRETLALAWHAAGTDPRAARLLLGMSRGVANIVAMLGLQEMEHMAVRLCRCLRPRWEGHPLFWRHLLDVAQGDDENARSDLHLQGLQLLGSELLPPRDPTPRSLPAGAP